MRKYIIVLLLLYTGAVILFANPFTGTKKTPAPVRSEKPSEFIVNEQAKLHTRLGDYMYEWAQTNSAQAFWAIMWLAFFYGFMHALGPGHRKTLVFSFYIGKPAPVWEPLLTSLVLAGLHGLTSIVLLLIFRNVSGAISVHTASAAIYLEGFSFIILLVLSSLSILHLLSHAFPHRFRHFHFGCGGHCHHTCTHEHHTHGKAEKMQWSAFMLSGIYPCPAALLVLVLVTSMDAAGLGVLTVISMSLGMTIPITIVAYLAWAGRAHLFSRMRTAEKYVQAVSLILGITAYGTIFIFSLVAVWPFLKSLAA